MKTAKIILFVMASIIATSNYAQITVTMPKIGFGKKEKTAAERKKEEREQAKSDSLWKIAQAEQYKKDELMRFEEQKKDILVKAENHKCPIDEYTGADKAIIKAKIEEAWSKDQTCSLHKNKILGIYLEESWERKKGFDEDLQEYDQTQLKGYIIFQNETIEEVGEVNAVTVWKDNFTDPNKIKCPKRIAYHAIYPYYILTKNVVAPK